MKLILMRSLHSCSGLIILIFSSLYFSTAYGQVAEVSISNTQTKTNTIQTQSITTINHRFEYNSGWGFGIQYAWLGYQGAFVDDYFRFRYAVSPLFAITAGIDFMVTDKFSIGYTGGTGGLIGQGLSFSYHTNSRYKGWSFSLDLITELESGFATEDCSSYNNNECNETDSDNGFGYLFSIGYSY